MKNKCADQTARMRRLVCAFVVREPPNTGFLESRPAETGKIRVVVVCPKRLQKPYQSVYKCPKRRIVMVQIKHSCMGIRYAKLFEAAKSMFKS